MVRAVELGLMLIALAILPAAQAAVRITTLDVPTTPIKPQIENPTFSLGVAVDCSTEWSRSPGGAGAPIQFTWTAPEGVTITGPADASLPQGACPTPSGSSNLTARFQVSIARTVPGLVPLAVSVTTAVEGTPLVDAAENGTSDERAATVTADYYSVNQLQVDSKLKECSSASSATFVFDVANLGNAATTYALALTMGPGGGWNASLPASITVERPTPGASTTMPGMVMPAGPAEPRHGSFAVTVACPAGARVERAFQVVVRPAASADASKAGNPLTVNFLARQTSASSHKSPALPSPALALGLAGAALASRRRRRP